jgi:hypothetical protein
MLTDDDWKDKEEEYTPLRTKTRFSIKELYGAGNNIRG